MTTPAHSTPDDAAMSPSTASTPSSAASAASAAAAAAAAEEKRERQIQVNLREANAAWKAVAYLITGPLIYGGIGWGLDHWLGTTWIVGAGIVGGMALSLYLIWFRYGTQ
ncbi:MAG: hypothetical protein JWP82_2649 [Humibacillus sp.]|nr:hypothetical protein [Humibacillus sp.]